jgi:hypothetical protein
MVSVLYCELQAHQGDQVPGEATHPGGRKLPFDWKVKS